MVAAKAAASKEEEEEAPASTVEIMVDAPVGPSPEEEVAMLTQGRGSEEFYGQPPKAENIEPEGDGGSLPPMEDLVKRIPTPTRDLLEELFRARFVTVKRVPKAALKS